MATDADKTPRDPLSPMDLLLVQLSILQSSVEKMSHGFENLEAIKESSKKTLQTQLEMQEHQQRESKQRVLTVSTCLVCALVCLFCTFVTALVKVGQ
jgi:succinate dehydrogenase/fumarate reductase-like Fe-S protein